jgi:membrane peptidoglycan carboxypeptidase
MNDWRPQEAPSWWRRLLPLRLHRPAVHAFRITIAAALVGSAIVFAYFLQAMRFDIGEVSRPATGAIFLDRNGREISAIGSGGKAAQRGDIPDFLVKSLLAREDARFFTHHGVDLRGVARAVLRNAKDGAFTQGASTLTMQLARNTYQLRGKSLHRKFLETALTLRIESHYTKDEILTHYLNRIYFGAGADGIEQAAKTYFGKPARQLDEGECALIVGIIRGPHAFSPLRNREKALEQRRQTLERMRQMGFLGAAEAEEIAARPLRLAEEQDRGGQTSYVLQAARRELDLLLDDESIRIDGLRVHTTLDAGWQRRLEDELNRAVSKLEAERDWAHPPLKAHEPGGEPRYVQYAAVTTESNSGGILALIGGRDFGHSRYDRTRSTRDLGSAFEPFIAAAAAERGKLVLAGRPVQTGRQIGPAEVERIAKRCGIEGPFVVTEDLFRGAVAATPLEMSVGLATLSNKGERNESFLIREIRDAKGTLLHRASPSATPAIDKQAAREALSVLSRREGTRCFTGATGSERDAWVLRVGPSGATAIWIGFDQPAAIAPETRLRALLDEFVDRLGNG